jgi:hypothetical protein
MSEHNPDGYCCASCGRKLFCVGELLDQEEPERPDLRMTELYFCGHRIYLKDCPESLLRLFNDDVKLLLAGIALRDG